MIEVKHRFHSKDLNTGIWLVYCPATRTSFSTSEWSNGQTPKQICPYCKRNVKELFYIKPTFKKETKHSKRVKDNHQLQEFIK